MRVGLGRRIYPQVTFRRHRNPLKMADNSEILAYWSGLRLSPEAPHIHVNNIDLGDYVVTVFVVVASIRNPQVFAIEGDV